MNRHPASNPTDRELQILTILWEIEEGTVREIYEKLRADGESIAQNTVQAFLRIMTEKGLVSFREQGRAFVYKASEAPSKTKAHLVRTLMNQVFSGAIHALVQCAFDAKPPTAADWERLDAMIDEYRRKSSKASKK